MHVQVHDWIRSHLPGRRPRAVLEIGSLDVNGGLRELFASSVDFHGIDRVAGPGVDEVADAADWCSTRRYDLVLSTEVLEHTARWPSVLANAWAALSDGGRLLVTCATEPRAPHSAVDGLAVKPGEHYCNVAPSEVVSVVRAWPTAAISLEIHLGRGDLYLLADKSETSPDHHGAVGSERGQRM